TAGNPNAAWSGASLHASLAGCTGGTGRADAFPPDRTPARLDQVPPAPADQDGAPLTSRMPVSSVDADMGWHTRISGSLGSFWLYSRAAPSILDACAPAASATAAGAAESHSYWPPACTYASTSPSSTAEIFAPADPIGTSSTSGSIPSANLRTSSGGRVRLTAMRSLPASGAGTCSGASRGSRPRDAPGPAVTGSGSPASVRTSDAPPVASA